MLLTKTVYRSRLYGMLQKYMYFFKNCRLPPAVFSSATLFLEGHSRAKLTKNLCFNYYLDNVKMVKLTSHMQGSYPLGISNTWCCPFVQQNMGSFFVTVSTGPVKLRHYENATKLEKISICFDKTAVFT